MDSRTLAMMTQHLQATSQSLSNIAQNLSSTFPQMAAFQNVSMHINALSDILRTGYDDAIFEGKGPGATAVRALMYHQNPTKQWREPDFRYKLIYTAKDKAEAEADKGPLQWHRYAHISHWWMIRQLHLTKALKLPLGLERTTNGFQARVYQQAGAFTTLIDFEFPPQPFSLPIIKTQVIAHYENLTLHEEATKLIGPDWLKETVIRPLFETNNIDYIGLHDPKYTLGMLNELIVQAMETSGYNQALEKVKFPYRWRIDEVLTKTQVEVRSALNGSTYTLFLKIYSGSLVETAFEQPIGGKVVLESLGDIDLEGFLGVGITARSHSPYEVNLKFGDLPFVYQRAIFEALRKQLHEDLVKIVAQMVEDDGTKYPRF